MIEMGPERPDEVILKAFDEDGQEKRVELRCSDAHWISALSQRIVDSHS